MDPLSLTATVVGLVATCAHVANRIRDLYAEIQGAPEALEQLALEAEMLSQSLGRLTIKDSQTGETRVKISRVESESDLQMTLHRVFQSCKSTLDSVSLDIDKAGGVEHEDEHDPGTEHEHRHGFMHFHFHSHKDEPHGHQKHHEKSENWDLNWVWDATAGRAIRLIDKTMLMRTVRKLDEHLVPLRGHRNNVSFLISILILESTNERDTALKQGGDRLRQIEHEYSPFRIQPPSLLMPEDSASQITFPMASPISPKPMISSNNGDPLKGTQSSAPERKSRLSWSSQEAPEPVHGALRRCLSKATQVAHIPYSTSLLRNEPQTYQSYTPETHMPMYSQSEPNPLSVNTSSSSRIPPSRPPFPNPSLSTSSYSSYGSVDSHTLSIIHTPPDDSNLSGVNIFVSDGGWSNHAGPDATIADSFRRLSVASHSDHQDGHTHKGSSLIQTNPHPGWRIGF